MKQLTPEQLEKRKKLNKKLLMFLVLPSFLLLAIVMMIPKDKASKERDAVASMAENNYNNGSVVLSLNGCDFNKATEITKSLIASFKQTPKIEHDSVFTYRASSMGHNNKMQEYTQKITIGKTGDGVKFTCSNDWDDDYSKTVNESTLDLVKLHLSNPTLKYN